jgi:antitoxin (DNA-binding transcriptional repressor) of toxin-antitoxin stability system
MRPKPTFPRLVKEVLQGEDVIIARGKTPLVRLTALPEARLQRAAWTAARAWWRQSAMISMLL